MEYFRQLGLQEEIVKAIEELKFEKPSEIQEKTIPLVLEGKDVLAGSATGSGKTLAFGSGILQYTQKGSGIQAIVLTPTRELAEQVNMALRSFSKYKPLNIVPIYGGVSISPQINQLQRADVVVGTPGRILDHLQRRTINLGKVKILVLDEADRMLDMGFIDDVERIISQCQKQRQTLLFSATLAPEITRLANRYMKQPIKISAVTQVDPKKLHHSYYNVQDNLKFSLLVHLLKHEHPGLIMVFCNTQRNTDFIARNLKLNNIDASAIHGGFSQAKRSRTMEQFHAKSVNVLVCTDVAARGLDIKGVSHVYNYDIPKDSKDYIHRVGRTARAGENGLAVNILAQRDHDNFSRILRDFDVKIEKTEMPQIERVFVKKPEHGREDSGRRFGNRGRSGGFRGRSSGNRGGSHRPRHGASRSGGSSGSSRFRSSSRSSSGSRQGSSTGHSSGSRHGNSRSGGSSRPRSNFHRRD